MVIHCALCHKLLNSENAETWCYHESIPDSGFACLHHHGVKREFERLQKEDQRKNKSVPKD